MAKAKKPASKAGTETGKTAGDTAKSASSVPKKGRAATGAAGLAKATGSVAPPVDAPKVTPPTDVKPQDAEAAKTSSAVQKASPKPADATVDVKTTQKTDPVASKSPTPSNSAPSNPAPKPAVPKQPEKSGSGFFPLVLGGAVAAVLGFVAAELNVLGTRTDDSDLRASLREQQAQIAALENAEPQTPQIDMPDIEPLMAELETVTETLSELDARLTNVEKRPMTEGGSPEAVAAYERELEALQASVREQRTEIEGLLDNALSVEEATADLARNATQQAALTRIMGAITTGQPYAAALADLEASGMNDIPDALADTAETGVVTLTNLQMRFPDTARAVLSVAREAGTDADTGGMAGFLKRQLGARSVAPRDGTDPDAVLSRAEAAVRDGRLTDALAELETLPEISQSDLDGWLADARARQAAEAAAADLSQRLTAN